MNGIDIKKLESD